MKPTELTAMIFLTVLVIPDAPLGQTPEPATTAAVAERQVKTKSGLMYEIVAEGTGQPPRPVRRSESMRRCPFPMAE
jgi:hypothetical protein